jgi:hypothetical protein
LEVLDAKDIWVLDLLFVEPLKILDLIHMVEEKEDQEKVCLQRLHGVSLHEVQKQEDQINGVINLLLKRKDNYGKHNLY